MTEENRIPTNIRNLLVLETLAVEARALTPTEIGRRIGLPKPTVHRLCATLAENGFLVRDPVSKGYRPGRRARRIANGLLHSSIDAAMRRQILNRVASTVKETVNFAAPIEDGMTYIDRVETDWAFRIQLPIGAVVPFHCTASGKTYLASLPRAAREKMVRAMSLTAETANSHVSPESLLRELEEVRRRGYAIDREELMDSMVALAVPVKDENGRYVAALAFHGPTQRLSIDGATEHLDTLRAASEELSAVLFNLQDEASD